MNELEDEPMDVQKRNPVVEEVSKGEVDRLHGRKTDDDPKGKSHFFRHVCKKEVPIPRINCCEVKRKKHELSRLTRCVKVEVFAPACKAKKIETIPRDCMTKEEYLDFLAKAKERCDRNCAKEIVIKRLRFLSPRIEELAQPTKRRVMQTLEERSSVLPAEFIEKLLRILECETALTPEQAENLVRDVSCAKKHEKKRKGKRKDKCEEHKITGAGDPNIDDEAANCQYLMAVRFVRSILNWKCCNPKKDYADIAQVLLNRLSVMMDYEAAGKEDCKSQQMRLLANIIACWIAGVLVEVTDRHKAEIAAECLRRQAEAEEMALRSALEEDADEDEEDLDNGSEDEDEERERLTAAASLATQAELEDLTAASTQYEEEDFESELDSSLMDSSLPEASVAEPPGLMDSVKSTAELDTDYPGFTGVDESAQTEALARADAGVDPDLEAAAASMSLTASQSALTQPKSQMSDVELVASRMMDAFKTDVPFITFAKIVETIFCMIECESENDLEQAMDNRIHRAIYEKFEAVIKTEDSSLLDERLKDVLDVTTGKIARWLRRTLNDRQINFLEENPATVESKELRDWSKKVIDVAEVAEDWSSWLIKETSEAADMKCKLGGLTRGDWQDWTGRFEADALLWRRAYLEAIHHQHHDVMMMTQRKVLKTGTSRKPGQYSETNIKTTDFESHSRLGQ